MDIKDRKNEIEKLALKSEDLQVGMKVYRSFPVIFGFYQHYRHYIYKEDTIERITPKRTKAYLASGNEISLKHSNPEPILYRYDEILDEESKIAQVYRHTNYLWNVINGTYKQKDIDSKIGTLKIQELSDKELSEVQKLIIELLKYCKVGEE